VLLESEVSRVVGPEVESAEVWLVSLLQAGRNASTPANTGIEPKRMFSDMRASS
jgi:hypothetical protein